MKTTTQIELDECTEDLLFDETYWNKSLEEMIQTSYEMHPTNYILNLNNESISKTDSVISGEYFIKNDGSIRIPIENWVGCDSSKRNEHVHVVHYDKNQINRGVVDPDAAYIVFDVVSPLWIWKNLGLWKNFTKNFM